MARNLRISIAAYRGETSELTSLSQGREHHVAEAKAHIEMAAAEGADLVVLPEVFALQDCAAWPEHAEPLDGFVISQLVILARHHRIGIAAGHATRFAGHTYNSLVLLDREGEIASLYHKAYPTIWELENGITPGPGAVVCETEFGRVGFAICYDLNFAELRLAYRDQNPELILFSSMFRGGLQTQMWAYETRSYLVSSVIDPRSLIVNPLGRAIAETDVWSRTVTRTISLDYKVIHLDYTNKTLREARLKYGTEFDFEWAEAEGVAMVTARGDKSTHDLLQEFGWETVEEYFVRARRAREDVLAGRSLPAGPAPW